MNENLARDLAGGVLIAQQRNMAIVGGAGMGRTHLAIATYDLNGNAAAQRALSPTLAHFEPATHCRSAQGPDADRRHNLLIANGADGAKSGPD